MGLEAFATGLFYACRDDIVDGLAGKLKFDQSYLAEKVAFALKRSNKDESHLSGFDVHILYFFNFTRCIVICWLSESDISVAFVSFVLMFWQVRKDVNSGGYFGGMRDYFYCFYQCGLIEGECYFLGEITESF